MEKLTIKQLFLITLLVLLSNSAFMLVAGVLYYNYRNPKFSNSKRILLSEIYKGSGRTIYSNCKFQNKKILLESCGYKIRKQPKRAKRLEWEHIVPISWLGKELKCWHRTKKYSARVNCRRTSKWFRRMESDMYNLYPSVGEINADRSNRIYGIIPGETRIYGNNIDVEIDFRKDIFEPRPEIRGDIARIHFYMEWRYGLKIPIDYRILLLKWDMEDPISQEEYKHAKLIEDIQFIRNPFVVKEFEDNYYGKEENK